MQITTIGLDIAKNVFQVHGIDASEKVVRFGSGSHPQNGPWPFILQAQAPSKNRLEAHVRALFVPIVAMDAGSLSSGMAR
jgi:hypothetical protein